MTTHNRFVFDTNTLISAALFMTSVPRQAVDKALLTGSLLVSEATSLEIVTVFLRPKFDRYIERVQRELFLATFLQQTDLITISETIRACRDAKDDKFLEVAVNGNADIIVTGDDDLLVLHPFRTISIVSPRDFIDRF
jgi:putative PIN family toxin of toxin-antitoxin system